MNFLKKHRNIILRLADIAIVIIGYYISEVIVTNNIVVDIHLKSAFLNTIIIATILYLCVLQFSGTYRNMLRYESANDYFVYLTGCVFSCSVMMYLNIITSIDLVKKRTHLLAGIIIGAMMSLTACGGETAQNIQENNEVSIGVNQEKKASELVDQMNSEYQNADDLIEGVTAE